MISKGHSRDKKRLIYVSYTAIYSLFSNRILNNSLY